MQQLFEGLRRRETQTACAARQTSTGTAPDNAGGPVQGPEDSGTPERVAKVVAHSFNKAPKATAMAVMRELGDLDRVHLILAMQQTVDKHFIRKQRMEYAGDLVKRIGPNTQHHGLTQEEITSALEYMRMLQKYSGYEAGRPRMRHLLAVALASGLPFCAFGFLDNSVMIVAGEQIDSVFGARLGLTTLASAALGNTIADILGVSVTHQIQDNVKRIVRPPRLSLLQQAMGSVRMAKFGGAVAGVCLGCFLGMAPLVFSSPGFFDPKRKELHEQQQQQQQLQLAGAVQAQQQQQEQPATAAAAAAAAQPADTS